MTADATTLPSRLPGAERSSRTSRTLALAALTQYRALHHRLGALDPEAADDRAFASGERWLLVWAGAQEWVVGEDAATRIDRLIEEIRDLEPPVGTEWLTAFPRAVAAALDRRTGDTASGQRRRFADRTARPTPRAGRDDADTDATHVPTGAGSR
ncbi:MAG TPA: hypothetical protein VFK54_10610 [Candidatus Limnocylindrales bacterium]|nr:hypothetical protein [Candidatus Limnocylindrales bacterium]